DQIADARRLGGFSQEPYRIRQGVGQIHWSAVDRRTYLQSVLSRDRGRAGAREQRNLLPTAAPMLEEAGLLASSSAARQNCSMMQSLSLSGSRAVPGGDARESQNTLPRLARSAGFLEHRAGTRGPT